MRTCQDHRPTQAHVHCRRRRRMRGRLEVVMAPMAIARAVQGLMRRVGRLEVDMVPRAVQGIRGRLEVDMAPRAVQAAAGMRRRRRLEVAMAPRAVQAAAGMRRRLEVAGMIMAVPVTALAVQAGRLRLPNLTIVKCWTQPGQAAKPVSRIANRISLSSLALLNQKTDSPRQTITRKKIIY